jgi:hypothetical protein
MLIKTAERLSQQRVEKAVECPGFIKRGYFPDTGIDILELVVFPFKLPQMTA